MKEIYNHCGSKPNLEKEEIVLLLKKYQNSSNTSSQKREIDIRNKYDTKYGVQLQKTPIQPPNYVPKPPPIHIYQYERKPFRAALTN